MATKPTTPKPAAAPTSATLKKDAKTASTAVAVRKPAGGAIVDIQAQLKAQAAAMAERTQAPTGNKIQPGNDKLFKLPNGTKVDRLDVCIVDFRSFHAFYESDYDAKNIVPPGCYAVGTNPKQMAPTEESPNLQAENCQVCPQNEFGSAARGDGKACKNGRRLALLPANDAGDDVDADGDMLVLEVSPTALKNFDGYVQSLARTFQQPPVAFLTTITLDPSTDYAKCMFSDPRPVTSIGEAFAKQAEAKDMLEALPDFTGWQQVQVKGARGAAPAKKVANARR